MHVDSHVNAFSSVTQTTLEKTKQQKNQTMTIQTLWATCICLQCRAVYKRASGGRPAAGAGDICDPAQQWWKPDTCFSLKGSWHRFCLTGLMPACTASHTHIHTQTYIWNTATKCLHQTFVSLVTFVGVSVHSSDQNANQRGLSSHAAGGESSGQL